MPDIFLFFFRYGALEVTPLKRREKYTRRSRKDGTGKTIQPKEVRDLKSEEETTTKGVGHVFEHLKRACRMYQKIHYFRFVVDPDSFAHTVENMFYFSFLIKVRDTWVWGEL